MPDDRDRLRLTLSPELRDKLDKLASALGQSEYYTATFALALGLHTLGQMTLPPQELARPLQPGALDNR